MNWSVVPCIFLPAVSFFFPEWPSLRGLRDRPQVACHHRWKEAQCLADDPGRDSNQYIPPFTSTRSHGPRTCHFSGQFPKCECNLDHGRILRCSEGERYVVPGICQQSTCLVLYSLPCSLCHQSKSVISRDTAILPRTLDWMVTDRADDLRSIMSDNATFIHFPSLGSSTSLITVYGDHRVNIQRTIRSIMQLVSQSCHSNCLNQLTSMARRVNTTLDLSGFSPCNSTLFCHLLP